MIISIIPYRKNNTK